MFSKQKLSVLTLVIGLSWFESCFAQPADQSSMRVFDAPWSALSDEAQAAFDKGNLSTAEAKWKEALKLADSSGAVEPGIVTCLTKLSLVTDRQGNAQESERLYELAMRTLEALVGRESAKFTEYMPDLAYLYQAHHKPAKAEVLFKKSIQIRERAFGETDMRVADACEDYAHFLDKEQRQTEAAQYYERARSIKMKLQ